MKIKDLEVHSLAHIIPMADPAEQLALQNDIDKNGQKTPILLYRRKIVDGRCRATACVALKIPVNTKSLSNNLTLKEVADEVKSANTRRNLTQSQKAIIAAKQFFLDSKQEQKAIYEAWGVSKMDFTAAKYLITEQKVFADLLFEGQAVPLHNGKLSNSVRAAASSVKAGIENLKSTMPTVVFNDRSFNGVDSLIKTEAGKEAYAKAIDTIGHGNFNATFYVGNDVRNFIASIADQFTEPKV